MRLLAGVVLLVASLGRGHASEAVQDECPWNLVDLDGMSTPANAELSTLGHSVNELTVSLPVGRFSKVCVQLAESRRAGQLPVSRVFPLSPVTMQASATVDASGLSSFHVPLTDLELPGEGSDFAASHATATLSVGMASLPSAESFRLMMGWSTRERHASAAPLVEEHSAQARWARRAALHGEHDLTVVTACLGTDNRWVFQHVTLRSFLVMPLPGPAKGAMVPWGSWEYVSRHHLDAAKAIVSAEGGVASWLRTNADALDAQIRQVDAERVAASACEAAIAASGDVEGADAWRAGHRKGNCPAPVPALLAALSAARESMLPVVCSGGRAGPVQPRPDADLMSWWAARTPVVEFRTELAAVVGRDDGCSRVAVLVGPTSGAPLDATAANWPGAWAVIAVDAWAGKAGSKLANKDVHADELAFKMAQASASQHGPRARVWREDAAHAVDQVPDSSVDYVVLSTLSRDYESTLRSMRAWWPKLRPGGLLAGESFADLLELPGVEVPHTVSDAAGGVDLRAVQSAVTDFAAHHGRQVGLTFGDSTPLWFMRR